MPTTSATRRATTRVTRRGVVVGCVAALALAGLGLAAPAGTVGATGGPGAQVGVATAVTFPVAERTPPESVVESHACWAADECVAVGRFAPASGGEQAFLARMTGGVWQPAAIPTFPVVETSPPDATARWVGCAAPGECVVGGAVAVDGGGRRGFVMRMTGGVWQAPVLLTFVGGDPLLQAEVLSGSCPGVGDCTLGGFYRLAGGGFGAFTVIMADGVPAPAVPVTYTITVDTTVDADAEVDAIACWAPGACALGGFVRDGISNVPWAAVMADGVVAPAAPVVPPSFPLPSVPSSTQAAMWSVTCPAPGECVGVGNFQPAPGQRQAFVAELTGGVWQPASLVGFVAPESTPPESEGSWVACTSVGECVGGGFANLEAGGSEAAFVMTMRDGVWAPARPVEFPAGLATGSQWTFTGACAAPGACVAAGYFGAVTGGFAAFVVTMVDGVWGEAEAVGYDFPVAEAGGADAWPYVVTCSPDGTCLVSGYVAVDGGGTQGFLLPVTVPVPAPAPVPGPRFVG